METGAALSDTSARDGARDYILDMVDQLATMARRAGEQELATHLKAVLDAARVAKRSRRV